jgi:hypothetical protein
MYSEYLPNLNDSLEKVKSSGDILSQINVKLQEGLLEQLIKVDNISNNLNQIAENNRDIRE